MRGSTQFVPTTHLGTPAVPVTFSPTRESTCNLTKSPSIIIFSIPSSSSPNSAHGFGHLLCLFIALSSDMCLHLSKSDSVWSQIFLPLPHSLHHRLQLHAPIWENSDQLFPGFAYCQLPPISFRVLVLGVLLPGSPLSRLFSTLSPSSPSPWYIYRELQSIAIFYIG